MYKLLLCWRYLRTRYIALASIISVTLGVATLIVVNSVMAGFTQEMYNRLHGILSDIVVECHSLAGLSDPQWHMQQIREVVGDDLAGILKMLTRSPDARGDLVEDIRAQLSAGSYLSEERLNLAIYKLLKDLLD